MPGHTRIQSPGDAASTADWIVWNSPPEPPPGADELLQTSRTDADADPAAPAFAPFHLEMVTEGMLASGTGDSSVQFVELLDNGGTEEQFTPVFGPYHLIIYDAAGNKLGDHTLNPNGLRAASAADREYLI